ncbi:hypothetical protein LRP30_13550 [Bradyrhizobium sp. C-145]|uniref:phage head-tail joining protein n=1 Tax=Bradyrhizobium sp. C-145 TaxID=574727 RepID=UPI00201B5578|nr:hypothetical protein [Bradyrhizobium sp. C-145]UQR66207.1 hypothetical protein LRP30_13550 [Bradyrhizobium sp. C-145]
MADPVYTTQQLQDIVNALASGAQRVSYGDKSVEFRSLSELREIFSSASASLTGTTQRRTFRMVTPPDKGL